MSKKHIPDYRRTTPEELDTIRLQRTQEGYEFEFGLPVIEGNIFIPGTPTPEKRVSVRELMSYASRLRGDQTAESDPYLAALDLALVEIEGWMRNLEPKRIRQPILPGMEEYFSLPRGQILLNSKLRRGFEAFPYSEEAA